MNIINYDHDNSKSKFIVRGYHQQFAVKEWREGISTSHDSKFHNIPWLVVARVTIYGTNKLTAMFLHRQQMASSTIFMLISTGVCINNVICTCFHVTSQNVEHFHNGFHHRPDCVT